jgi:hypothetical protein
MSVANRIEEAMRAGGENEESGEAEEMSIFEEEQMRAGSAGISDISGASASAPSVRRVSVANGIEKATRQMGGRRARRRWRWRR